MVESVDVLKYQYLGGQSPLILACPHPRLAVTANLSIFNHILTARQNYRLPQTAQELICAIRYADYIADAPFISRVSHCLQLPRTKMMYSIPFEEFRRIIRNRFRQLRNGRTLKPPPCGRMCIKCGEDVLDNTVETYLGCCQRCIHKSCVADDDQCSYCGTSWVLLSCCVCKNPICMPVKNRHVSYAEYGSFTTSCCGAQLHLDCMKGPCQSPCSICGSLLDEMGFHHDDWTTPFNMLSHHNMKRRHDYMRRTLQYNKYDRLDYLNVHGTSIYVS